MATDLSALTPFRQSARVALDGTPDNLTQVTLPDWARVVTVAFKKNDGVTDDSGFLLFTGVDGASKGTNWFPIGSGGAYEFGVNPRATDGAVMFLAATTATAWAHVMIER